MSWEQLGIEVRNRRADLGLTQTDVPAGGGPSVETLRMVENNRAGRLSLDPPMGCWCGVECDCAALNRVGAGGGRAWSPDLCIGLFLFVFRVEGRWGLAG